MLSDLQQFPGSLFPGSSTKLKGKSVIDYGVSDVVDICMDDQRLEIYPKLNAKPSNVGYRRLTPIGTCLPLILPNDVGNLPIYEEINDVSICQHEHHTHAIGTTLKTTKTAQLNRLLIDHPELLIGSIIDELDQSQIDMLRRSFHPLVYGCDVPMTYSKRVHRLRDFKKFFKDTSQTRKRAMVRFSYRRPLESKHFIKELNELWDAIFEMPNSLLLDYLEEELVMKYDDITANHQLGNCLASYKDFLIYPTGSLDSVCVTPLQVSFDEGAELESNISQTIKMNGKTQEIIAQDFDDGSLFMGVRHDYGCCFLKNSAKVSKKEQKYFDIVDEVHTKSRVLSMSINPYFSSEAIFLLNDGNLNVWDDGNVISVGDKTLMKNYNHDDICWVNCIYGSNPRTVLYIHSGAAFTYDIRAPKRPSQLILQLPNTFLNCMDKLSRPASIHTSNPHHILLTTEQGLVLVDERFTNSPLITLNHYMRSNPQFMQTLANENDSSVRTYTFLGGHQYSDIRCLEFEQRLIGRSKLFQEQSSKKMVTQAPICPRMPWKLSSSDSWLRNVTNDSRITSPGISRRMRQPLIGLNIMKIEAPSILDLIAVQLTGSGDLFYQFLTSKGANEADDDSHIQSNGIFGMDQEICFDKKAKENCMQWIDSAYKMYYKNKFFNEEAKLSTLEINTDDGDIVKAFNMQAESRDCFLRREKETRTHNEAESHKLEEVKNGIDLVSGENVEHKERKKIVDDSNARDDSDDNDIEFCCLCKRPLENKSEKCNGCNLNVRVTNKLKWAYGESSFLSNKSLEQESEIPDWRLIKNLEKSKDPLSVILLKNWNDDECYTLLESTNIYSIIDNGNEIDKEKKHKTKRKRSMNLKRLFDDLMGKDDGWYLSATGNLEFGEKDNADLEIGETLEGYMTRSKVKRIRTLEKRRKTEKKKRSENLADHDVKAGSFKLKNKKLSDEQNIELGKEANLNERTGHEDEFSPKINEPKDFKIVRDLFRSTNESGYEDDLIRSKMSFHDDEEPIINAEIDSSLRADDQYDLDMALDSSDVTPKHRPKENQQPKSLRMSDDTFSFTSEFDGRNTPSKIYSSVKGQRTPRKKKVAREMGF